MHLKCLSDTIIILEAYILLYLSLLISLRPPELDTAAVPYFLSKLDRQSKSPFVSGDILSCSVIYTCGKTLQAANTNPNTDACITNVPRNLTRRLSARERGGTLKNTDLK